MIQIWSMSGKVLDYEAKAILNEGIAIGEKRGKLKNP